MTYACAFCGEENDTFVDPAAARARRETRRAIVADPSHSITASRRRCGSAPRLCRDDPLALAGGRGVYADLDQRDTSMGSSIASTIQQMSMSFGVAAASLTTAVFRPGPLNHRRGAGWIFLHC